MKIKHRYNPILLGSMKLKQHSDNLCKLNANVIEQVKLIHEHVSTIKGLDSVESSYLIDIRKQLNKALDAQNKELIHASHTLSIII